MSGFRIKVDLSGLQGSRHSTAWFLVDGACADIGQLKAAIFARFKLPTSDQSSDEVELWLDDCVIPDWEPVSLLSSNDTITLRPVEINVKVVETSTLSNVGTAPSIIPTVSTEVTILDPHKSILVESTESADVKAKEVSKAELGLKAPGAELKATSSEQKSKGVDSTDTVTSVETTSVHVEEAEVPAVSTDVPSMLASSVLTEVEIEERAPLAKLKCTNIDAVSADAVSTEVQDDDDDGDATLVVEEDLGANADDDLNAESYEVVDDENSNDSGGFETQDEYYVVSSVETIGDDSNEVVIDNNDAVDEQDEEQEEEEGEVKEQRQVEPEVHEIVVEEEIVNFEQEEHEPDVQVDGVVCLESEAEVDEAVIPAVDTDGEVEMMDLESRNRSQTTYWLGRKDFVKEIHVSPKPQQEQEDHVQGLASIEVEDEIVTDAKVSEQEEQQESETVDKDQQQEEEDMQVTLCKDAAEEPALVENEAAPVVVTPAAVAEEHGNYDDDDDDIIEVIVVRKALDEPEISNTIENILSAADDGAQAPIFVKKESVPAANATNKDNAVIVGAKTVEPTQGPKTVVVGVPGRGKKRGRRRIKNNLRAAEYIMKKAQQKRDEEAAEMARQTAASTNTKPIQWTPPVFKAGNQKSGNPITVVNSRGPPPGFHFEMPASQKQQRPPQQPLMLLSTQSPLGIQSRLPPVMHQPFSMFQAPLMNPPLPVPPPSHHLFPFHQQQVPQPVPPPPQLQLGRKFILPNFQFPLPPPLFEQKRKPISFSFKQGMSFSPAMPANVRTTFHRQFNSDAPPKLSFDSASSSADTGQGFWLSSDMIEHRNVGAPLQQQQQQQQEEHLQMSSKQTFDYTPEGWCRRSPPFQQTNVVTASGAYKSPQQQQAANVKRSDSLKRPTNRDIRLKSSPLASNREARRRNLRTAGSRSSPRRARRRSPSITRRKRTPVPSRSQVTPPPRRRRTRPHSFSPDTKRRSGSKRSPPAKPSSSDRKSPNRASKSRKKSRSRSRSRGSSSSDFKRNQRRKRQMSRSRSHSPRKMQRRSSPNSMSQSPPVDNESASPIMPSIDSWSRVIRLGSVRSSSQDRFPRKNALERLDSISSQSSLELIHEENRNWNSSFPYVADEQEMHVSHRRDRLDSISSRSTLELNDPRGGGGGGAGGYQSRSPLDVISSVSSLELRANTSVTPRDSRFYFSGETTSPQQQSPYYDEANWDSFERYEDDNGDDRYDFDQQDHVGDEGGYDFHFQGVDDDDGGFIDDGGFNDGHGGFVDGDREFIDGDGGFNDSGDGNGGFNNESGCDNEGGYPLHYENMDDIGGNEYNQDMSMENDRYGHQGQSDYGMLNDSDSDVLFAGSFQASFSEPRGGGRGPGNRFSNSRRSFDSRTRTPPSENSRSSQTPATNTSPRNRRLPSLFQKYAMKPPAGGRPFGGKAAITKGRVRGADKSRSHAAMKRSSNAGNRTSTDKTKKRRQELSSDAKSSTTTPVKGILKQSKFDKTSSSATTAQRKTNDGKSQKASSRPSEATRGPPAPVDGKRSTDYSTYPVLDGQPNINDIIAYKMFDIDESETLEDNGFKVGKVIQYDPSHKDVLLESRQSGNNEGRSGEVIEEVALDWTCFSEVRLISRNK